MRWLHWSWISSDRFLRYHSSKSEIFMEGLFEKLSSWREFEFKLWKTVSRTILWRQLYESDDCLSYILFFWTTCSLEIFFFLCELVVSLMNLGDTRTKIYLRFKHDWIIWSSLSLYPCSSRTNGTVMKNLKNDFWHPWSEFSTMFRKIWHEIFLQYC